MANSTTNLDLVSASQANKEVTVNAALDAASPAMLYGRRAVTTAGLAWGYYGGVVSIGGTPTVIANGVVTLTASATNYVEANPADGTVSANTTGFTADRKPLYTVVTGSSAVTSYTDLRIIGSDGSAAASEAMASHVAASDPHPQYLTAAEGNAAYDAAGAASAAVSAHVAASDPHPQYMTQSEADARYLQSIGPQPFDVHAFYPGVPAASAKILRTPLARAVAFPDDFAGSYGIASVAATAQTDFVVSKNGVQVGTISFAAAATVATFVTSGAGVTLVAGDRISITGPATPDATLADVGFVLAGTR